MYKVTEVFQIKPFTIVCLFTNGIKKKLEVLPLLQNHAHLQGIDQLKDKAVFNKVAVGEMGEVFWENIITSKTNEKWNYDISPDYIFHNGITIQ